MSADIAVLPQAPSQLVITQPSPAVLKVSGGNTLLLTQQPPAVLNIPSTGVSELISVGIPGPPGPPGPQGQPGAGVGVSLTYNGSGISWNIVHNLGRIPQVVVQDPVDKAVGLCGITYPDNNHLVLDFATPFTGVAYIY